MTFRVLAIVAARNEADIINESIHALTEQGVSVYVIDDGSTDDTAAISRTWIGRGVVGVEQRDAAERPFDWTSLLRRKEELAHSLDADWFIHHDADEFRESPWPDVALVDAIAKVDAAGYNAINFGLLEFWPTDGAGSGADVRHRLTGYLPGAAFNRTQIRCWKRGPRPVDLVSSGGHDAAFDNRNIFPLRFLLRHYPIRSEEHGRTKIFAERLPRFVAEERERGWHIQYDGLCPDSSLSRTQSELMLFNPSQARMSVALEDLAALERARGETDAAMASALREIDAVRQECESLAEQERSALDGQTRLTSELRAVRQSVQNTALALQGTRDELARVRQKRLDAEAQLAAARAESEHQRRSEADTYARVTARHAETTSAYTALSLERDRIWRDLQALHASKTWRCTRPLRRLIDLAAAVRGQFTP